MTHLTPYKTVQKRVTFKFSAVHLLGNFNFRFRMEWKVANYAVRDDPNSLNQYRNINMTTILLSTGWSQHTQKRDRNKSKDPSCALRQCNFSSVWPTCDVCVIFDTKTFQFMSNHREDEWEETKVTTWLNKKCYGMEFRNIPPQRVYSLRWAYVAKSTSNVMKSHNWND